MSPTPRLFLLAVVFAGLLAAALWSRAWGAAALLLVTAAGLAWYRVQVSRAEAAEQFFGEGGEETRLTGFQGGSPSEMPVDRGAVGAPPPAPGDRH
jgi:hypothetical protein